MPNPFKVGDRVLAVEGAGGYEDQVGEIVLSTDDGCIQIRFDGSADNVPFDEWEGALDRRFKLVIVNEWEGELELTE